MTTSDHEPTMPIPGVTMCEDCGAPLDGGEHAAGCTEASGDPILCPRCEGDESAEHNGYGEDCATVRVCRPDWDELIDLARADLDAWEHAGARDDDDRESIAARRAWLDNIARDAQPAPALDHAAASVVIALSGTPYDDAGGLDALRAALGSAQPRAPRYVDFRSGMASDGTPEGAHMHHSAIVDTITGRNVGSVLADSRERADRMAQIAAAAWSVAFPEGV